LSNRKLARFNIGTALLYQKPATGEQQKQIVIPRAILDLGISEAEFRRFTCSPVNSYGSEKEAITHEKHIP
jgi:hypothetical protein